MISDVNLTGKIGSWLFSDNLLLMRLSWKLLHKFTVFPPILSILFKVEGISKAFGKMPKESSPNKHIQLSKMLKFSLSVFKIGGKKNPENQFEISTAKKLLCDAMEPCIGPLVCQYQTMNRSLRGMEATKQILKEFFEFVHSSSAPELASYKAKVIEHMAEKGSKKKWSLHRSSMLKD